MNLKKIFKWETTKHQVLSSGYIATNRSLCVQCGICTYNCPLEIDVRMHVWRGEPVKDSRCLTCGECVARCPRGGLRFQQNNLLESSVVRTEL
jgi:ferredoxin